MRKAERNQGVGGGTTVSDGTSVTTSNDVRHHRSLSSLATSEETIPRDLWFVIAFFASAVILPLIYLDQPLHFDEGIFLTIGNQLASGETLYADIADHKPPGVFFVATAVYHLFDAPVVAARLLTYGVIAGSGLLVVRLGQQFRGRLEAQVAGVLFVVMSYLPHFDGFYFMTEPYAVLAMLVAAVSFTRDSAISRVGAGVALGIGVLFNQTVFLFGATILLYHLLKSRFPEARTRDHVVETTERILTIGVGFLATMAAVATVLYSRGILRETFYYALVVPLTNYSTPFDLWGHILAFATLLPVWLLAGGMVLLVGAAVVRGVAVDDRQLFVALWAVVMSIPGARAFSGDHKFLFAFPALALLTAIASTEIYRAAVRNRDQFRDVRAGLPDRSALLAGLLIVVVFSTTLVAGAGNVYYASNVLEDDIAEERTAAENALDGIDGPVYAFNVEASLYVHTDTEPGTTYLGTIYSDRIANDKISDLQRNDVRYVAVREFHVTDGNVVSDRYWSDHKSIMTDYLNRNYEPVDTRGGYVIFERVKGEGGQPRR